MTYDKLFSQLDEFGVRDVEDYARGCRRVSIVCLILALLFLLLAQGLTFFVALETTVEPGGYSMAQSLLFALVPVAGPVFALTQMLLAGMGQPLLILPLLAPGLLLLLLAANRRDASKKAAWALDNHAEIAAGDDPLMTLPELHDILANSASPAAAAAPAAEPAASFSQAAPPSAVRLEPNLTAPRIIRGTPEPAPTAEAAPPAEPVSRFSHTPADAQRDAPASVREPVQNTTEPPRPDRPAVQDQIQDVLSLLDKYKDASASSGDDAAPRPPGNGAE